jgi:hypothetical protein
VLGAEFRAGPSNRNDLGVRGRILGLRDQVRALGDDLAVTRDYACKWAPAILNILQSQLDCAPRKVHRRGPS